MDYRILIRPRWTTFNNSPNTKWRVQYKLWNFIWITTGDKWDTREDAEQWVADRRNIL